MTPSLSRPPVRAGPPLRCPIALSPPVGRRCVGRRCVGRRCVGRRCVTPRDAPSRSCAVPRPASAPLRRVPSACRRRSRPSPHAGRPHRPTVLKAVPDCRPMSTLARRRHSHGRHLLNRRSPLHARSRSRGERAEQPERAGPGAPTGRDDSAGGNSEASVDSTCRLRRSPGVAGARTPHAPRLGPKTTKAPSSRSSEGAFRHQKSRRRPTLPGGLPPSTIGAGGLNCRVRNGNGCFPAAMATGNLALGGSPTPRRVGATPGCDSAAPERSKASTSTKMPPSPRPISTGRLNALLHLHLRPINVVV